MDRTAFELDVARDMSEGTFTAQHTTEDGVLTITKGETWLGALYGVEQNAYGQRVVHLFETEHEQHSWYEALTQGVDSLYH